MIVKLRSLTNGTVRQRTGNFFILKYFYETMAHSFNILIITNKNALN